MKLTYSINVEQKASITAAQIQSLEILACDGLRLKEMLQTLSSPRLDRLLAVLHTLCKPQEAPDPCALDSSVKKDG